jgi:threonine dehydrogenase-like Zn-dependent dehydrogenase
MKAIQIVAPKKVEIVNVPVPSIAADEVLVRVECCVTCPHWDITLYNGVDIFERPGFPKYPIPYGYPGHEMAGIVTAAGEQVTSLKIGDRVATLCTAGEFSPGFYCEYVNRPEGLVTKIPDEVSYEAAASMEMCRFMVPYIRMLGLDNIIGKRVGVTGMGPAGLIAMQMLKSLGSAEVVAVDVIPERLELAKKLGADETVNSATDEIKKLKDKPLGAAIDCSGISAGLQIALDHTRGSVSVFGVPHGNTVFTTRHWGTNILSGGVGGPTAEDTNFVLSLWRRRQLNTAALVTVKLPFERYAEGVELLMARKAIKVGFYPG